MFQKVGPLTPQKWGHTDNPPRPHFFLLSKLDPELGVKMVTPLLGPKRVDTVSDFGALAVLKRVAVTGHHARSPKIGTVRWGPHIGSTAEEARFQFWVPFSRTFDSPSCVGPL